MAAILRQAGVKVTAEDLREVDPATAAGYDLIVVGAPVFYYDAPALVQTWARSLPSSGEPPWPRM